MSPDLILHNAKVYAVDSDKPWTEAIAVRGSQIVAVGANHDMLAMVGDSTRVIDLEGRLVLPGLCDAHIHFYDWCLGIRLIGLDACRSLDNLVQTVAQWGGDFGGTGWVFGRGWNENIWTSDRLPTRNDVDRAVSDRPAMLWRADMHTAVVNSEALRLAGIDKNTPNPEGGVIGRDAQGRPNGLLYELANIPVLEKIPAPDPDWLDDAIHQGVDALHRMGITAVHDQRLKDQFEGPMALKTYQRLNAAGNLKLRINCNIAAHLLPHVQSLALGSGFGDDYVRLGHIKLFADGTLGSQTAWMLEPFEGTQNTGLCVTPAQQILKEFRQAAECGFPISIHAIGDRANREALNAFETLRQDGLFVDIPHRIEHVQTIHPDDLPRLGKLGLTASVQPIHATDDRDVADRLLGERTATTYAFRSLRESGALLALGSDAPVADGNPFAGMHAAVHRNHPTEMNRAPWHPEQCLTLEQAIAGYTLNAAKAGGWQGTIGSISPGKKADLIVLSQDIFQADNIAETQVLMTVFDGNVVHDTRSVF